MSMKALIITALEEKRGDDVFRARRAFLGKTPEQMQQEYGLSGKTCAEVLAGCEEHYAKYTEAIKWIEANLKEGRL